MGQKRHRVVFEFVSHIYMCNNFLAPNALEPAWILEFLGQMGQQKKCTLPCGFAPTVAEKF
jgi:hypothetical protein